MKIRIIFVSILSLILFDVQAARAVIPPDFVFNLGTQIIQFFSIAAVFFMAMIGILAQYFKSTLYTIKSHKLVLVLAIIGAVFVSIGSSVVYAKYKQNKEYEAWLEESRLYELPSSIVSTKEDTRFRGDVLLEEDIEIKETTNDINDQLIIGNVHEGILDVTQASFISKVDVNDPVGKFISNYYRLIASGNIEEAYSISKQTVSFDTFTSWYVDTTKIRLDKLVRIDKNVSSIELTLYDGDIFTTYGVLMVLDMQNGEPSRVASSDVRVLVEGRIVDSLVEFDDDVLLEEYAFFVENSNHDRILTNEALQQAISSDRDDYIILDARENLEVQNGNFPDSVHIRFADLKAGSWIDVPNDKFVYVLCWSGIRGKEVSDFLRTKNIVSSYIEHGANGWVEDGGIWEGDIDFGSTYDEKRYRHVYTTDEIKREQMKGVFVVDSREPHKFEAWQISGSVNIPTMYTPTINLEEVFAQVPTNSKVVTVCDGFVNCFDAKITGVELEQRGHEFLGRYNRPWEYDE